MEPLSLKRPSSTSMPPSRKSIERRVTVHRSFGPVNHCVLSAGSDHARKTCAGDVFQVRLRVKLPWQNGVTVMVSFSVWVNAWIRDFRARQSDPADQSDPPTIVDVR